MRQLILLPLFLACLPHVKGQAVVFNIGVTFCDVKCIHRSSCRSFAYNLNTLTCRLSRRTATGRTMKGYVIRSKGKQLPSANTCSSKTCSAGSQCLENHMGRAVCVTVRPSPRTLGKRCRSTADCAGPGFICFSGKCKCTPGFSFNYATETCVRRCKVYGSRMTIYRGLDMKFYNNLELRTSSLKYCIERCIREKRFVCLTVEFSESEEKCNLSKKGYLDIKASYRNKGDRRWILGSRNCAFVKI
ncbi:uncharacterized protein LOC124111640 [Haliotis rufescens]|uniref:uncharacterized protein LOC124111640 n=1 Tax=Haliotis rufescens TaxID=6454 RepID=UPI00201F947B|nr:uncharacterized protein LOC124111640 [Haliotis rufescens]